MGNDVFRTHLSVAIRFTNLTAWSLGGRNMGILTGILGFIITLVLLRRKGSAGRHIGAFFLAMAVSLLLFGFWVAANLPAGGNWRPERMAALWGFAIVLGLVLQAIAMLIAMLLRRRVLS